VTVFRPADAVETAAAWKVALEAGRPVALALTRQDLAPLPVERRIAFEGVARGGYVVAGSGTPAVVLVASGSEVGLALAAARQLEARGVATRVVSMPSGTPIVAIEAGRGETLRRFVGRRGLVIGMERFGASAPYQALAEHFGFTAASVAKRVKAHV
jgi:transketolase